MTHDGFRKLAACVVLASAGVASLYGAMPASVAPSLHVSPQNSANIQALENYQLVALKSVHFAAHDSHLAFDEMTMLNAWAKRFCQYSNLVFEVRGYADGGASAEQNLAASGERATAVARFLSDHGVPSKRILLIGLGEVDPADPVVNPEHQRVDIRVFAP